MPPDTVVLLAEAGNILYLRKLSLHRIQRVFVLLRNDLLLVEPFQAGINFIDCVFYIQLLLAEFLQPLTSLVLFFLQMPTQDIFGDSIRSAQRTGMPLLVKLIDF